jgi:aspartate/methionine/tyrosine aminotransferase
MKVDEFLVERWMNTYEHNVKYNLAETCVDPFTLAEFLNFVEKTDFFDDFKHKQLTYGYIEGNPLLREGLASLYDDVKPENILVTGGAIEANFNSFYSLIEPGDTVISVAPTYQQLFSVPKSFGARVKILDLKPENHWLPDIEQLKELVDQKTKMIVINNPNNPCGSLIDEATLKAICEIAEEVDAFVHSDEAYRGLYIDPHDRVSSVADIYDKGIAVGSFSKAFSLTGLRLGWITSNHETTYQFMLRRDYTTISKSMLNEAIAALAVPYIDKILSRNNKIVRENWKTLDNWINKEPLIDWVRPSAGSVAFMEHHINLKASDICLQLIKEKSTFMVPGDCFEQPKYLRIGYGNNPKQLKKGLLQVSEYLEKIEKSKRYYTQ